MKVLFIGGSGVISSACSQLAVEQGIDLYLLNRGQSDRPVPAQATALIADINNPSAVQQALAGHRFDAVVHWIAFVPQQIRQFIDLFRERAGQFIFISSASVYQTPPASLPVTESTLTDNPYWEYSRNKIACEELLVQAYREHKFPMTIVRPSHTYDCTKVPLLGGTTALARMREGKPVIVLGDGTSLWTLTHHVDFARGFVPLLGNARAIGEVVHITSDEWLTWNQIYDIMGQALGIAPELVHLPSELIAAYAPDLGAGLLGDKSHSMIFDNSKIRRLAPGFSAEISFSWGAREIVAWHLADPARLAVDDGLDALMDRLIALYRSIWPQ